MAKRAAARAAKVAGSPADGRSVTISIGGEADAAGAGAAGRSDPATTATTRNRCIATPRLPVGDGDPAANDTGVQRVGGFTMAETASTRADDALAFMPKGLNGFPWQPGCL